MIILGIDPSLNCTGWCMWDDEARTWEIGTIEPPTNISVTKKIHMIVSKFEEIRKNRHVEYCFIEAEAYYGQGNVVQLAELLGALRQHFWGLATWTFTYPPTMARKIVLGVSNIPYDKKKDPKKYCDFIRSKTRLLTTNDSPDIHDAFIICQAGIKELSSIDIDKKLATMRLHDEKILTKNRKNIYTFGKGKKKVTFKLLSKVDKETFSLLERKYREILGQEGKQLYKTNSC